MCQTGSCSGAEVAALLRLAKTTALLCTTAAQAAVFPESFPRTPSPAPRTPRTPPHRWDQLFISSAPANRAPGFGNLPDVTMELNAGIVTYALLESWAGANARIESSHEAAETLLCQTLPSKTC
mmetsp:Transcript_1839/g.4361  ORF Transcript_1839/g.4361 Transcript_1839/m.4361 type:complete len:124 (+) Transcript_1839:143-514(+)